jgi:hypothetical protein
MSPASGDTRADLEKELEEEKWLVSIQLMSPASGDLRVCTGGIPVLVFPFN